MKTENPYKDEAICKGSIILGTACGFCRKCQDEIALINARVKPIEKTLIRTDWISLKQNGHYIYSHEERCDGRIVAVLPYRRKEDYSIEYLIRKERNLAWEVNSKNKDHVTCITGGVDSGDPDDAAKTALQEIEEEAGFVIPLSKLYDVGIRRASKSNTAHYYLFLANLTLVKQTKIPEGDGSEDETLSYCYWASGEEMRDTSNDALLDCLHYQFMVRSL